MRAILKAVPIAVQIGGGIRDRLRAERWLDAGADRVVIGTLAVKDPETVQGLCAAHPGRVVIAIDARGDEVAIEGWREVSGQRVRELAASADAWGATAVLYTDITRDGTGEGPAVERTAALQKSLRATVIASGGIGAIEDVRALKQAGVRAAVCGRALYSGALDLAQALREAGEG